MQNPERTIRLVTRMADHDLVAENVLFDEARHSISCLGREMGSGQEACFPRAPYIWCIDRSVQLVDRHSGKLIPVLLSHFEPWRCGFIADNDAGGEVII